MREVDVEQLRLFETGPDMAKIRHFVGEMKQATRAKGTLVAYASDWRHYEAWCAAAGKTCIPAAADTIALYVADRLSNSKLSISTMERQVAAIAYYHRLRGLPNPDREEARAVIAGARRRRKEVPKQRTALTAEHLRKICEKLMLEAKGGSMVAARNRAILTLGFSTGLRRSNLRLLDVSDVRFIPRKGLVVSVRYSKTDQEGRGQLLRVYRGVRESTCPARSLQTWLDARGDWEGALFVTVQKNRWGGETMIRRRIHGEQINQIVKRGLRSIGKSDENFGAHSLRAGFVTTAHLQRTNTLEIMQYTGHRTVEMVNRYLRPLDFPSRSPLGRAI